MSAVSWMTSASSCPVTCRQNRQETCDCGGPNATGFDLTFLASTHLNPRLELFGALDAAFDSFDDIDFTRKTWHIVPGIEYRISENLDFVGEVGVAVSDDGRSYVAGGLAYYIR